MWRKERHYIGFFKTERELNVSKYYGELYRCACNDWEVPDLAVMICNIIGYFLAFLSAKRLNTAHQHQPAEQMEREGKQIEQQEV